MPFVSFAHLYGAWPERASFSLPFCPIFPPLWRAARAGQLIIAFLRNFPPLWRAAEAGLLIIAFLCNFPPLWRAARPRSGRSVGGPGIICPLFHLPTFMARGPSRPAFNCLSAQFSPVMARGPSRPAYRLPFCSICPRFGARPSGPAYQCLAALCRVRPDQASLSFARHERASLSFAFMPDLRRSPTRVKSTPWAGGGGDALLFYEGLQPLAHEG